MMFDTPGLPSRSFSGFLPIASGNDDGFPSCFVVDIPHRVARRGRGCFDEAGAARQRQGCRDGAAEPSDAASLAVSSWVDRTMLWFDFPSSTMTRRASRAVEVNDPFRGQLRPHRTSGRTQKMRMGIDHG